MVDLGSHIIDRLEAVDVIDLTSVSVVVDDRVSGLVEGFKSGSKGFSGVILAVHERLSSDIVLALNLRRAGSQMVRASRGGVNSASYNSVTENFLVDLEVDDLVNSLATSFHHLIKSLSHWLRLVRVCQ